MTSQDSSDFISIEEVPLYLFMCTTGCNFKEVYLYNAWKAHWVNGDGSKVIPIKQIRTRMLHLTLQDTVDFLIFVSL